MNNLSDNKPIDYCLDNHLMPFSAYYNNCLTINKNFCKYIPLFFSTFFLHLVCLHKIITTLSHMINIYEYKLIEQCKSNHLTPFTAFQARKIPRYKIFCAYAPLLFPHFPHTFYAFIKSISTLSNMIYVYDYKLIDHNQINHLTPLSAIPELQMLRYKNFCKYTPFIFPLFLLYLSMISIIVLKL